MAYRCPGCNNFTSISPTQEHETSLGLETFRHGEVIDAHVSGYVQVILISKCCSKKLKEHTFGIDIWHLKLERNGSLDTPCTCEGDDWLRNAQIWDVHVDARKARYRSASYPVNVTFEIVCGCEKRIGWGEGTGRRGITGYFETRKG